MTEAIIGLGSNLGKGRDNLQQAWNLLGRIQGIRPRQLSSPYFTEPVDMDSRHWFTNAVGIIETSLQPEALLAVLAGIEQEMGRKRDNTGLPADRIIDLDLLYFGDLVISTGILVIPHAAIQDRLFVLMPLAELRPEYRHPVLGLTSLQMLRMLLSSVELEPTPQRFEKMAWKEKPAEKTRQPK